MIEMLCAKVDCDYNQDNECLLPTKCPIDYTNKEAVENYVKYRNSPSSLHKDKLYVMEAYYKYLERTNDFQMTFKDWLFDYLFKGGQQGNGI